MRAPRLRVVLPVALVVTVIAPVLRLLPGGATLPDVWLLLLLWAVPVPAPSSWRRAAVLVIVLSLMRSSVSAVSPFGTLAGLGGGLAVRQALFRRLSDDNPLLRFVVGAGAALPLAVLDERGAALLGGEADAARALGRAAWVGLIWALALRPLGRLRRRRRASP